MEVSLLFLCFFTLLLNLNLFYITRPATILWVASRRHILYITHAVTKLYDGKKCIDIPEEYQCVGIKSEMTKFDGSDFHFFILISR